MKDISVCIISLALLLATAGVSAQTAVQADSLLQDSVRFPLQDSVLVVPEMQDTLHTAGTLPVDTANTPEEQPAEKIKIYEGTALKVDLFNPLYALFGSGGEIQAYEALVHVNLQNKYFPTIEAGYAHVSHTAKNEAAFNGGGVFSRIGADFNLMKKNKESGNYFLGGLRFGMAQQKFSITGIHITDGYWNTSQTISYPDRTKFDCWAEVVGGAHVKVYKGFNMGWSVRFKFLITRKEEVLHTWYIPGFGYKANTTFGFNYYIGYTF